MRLPSRTRLRNSWASTVTELADQVSAEAPLDTVLINITVGDPDPRQAQRIASSRG